MNKIAFITGITGQDGSYLAELLLEKGYHVHGMIRRSSTINTGRIDHIFNQLHLHYGDMTDGSGLVRLIDKIEPDEVYNLAAQSHVKVSFDEPEYTSVADGIGFCKLLEACRVVQGWGAHIYQAGTSEMFGTSYNSTGMNQDETTPFHPQSPYGCAKLYAHWMGVNYRSAYKMHISNGILFNHESPRRGETFISRKTTLAIANILKGKQDFLHVGNVMAIRDWGHAKDYVRAMWMMLQEEYPDDYVIATGRGYIVQDLINKAFAYAGMNLDWDYDNGDLIARDKKSGIIRVRSTGAYHRPNEVPMLLGNSTKALKQFGWMPTISFDGLINEMVDHDTRRVVV